MNEFQLYREAYDAMEADPKVLGLRQRIEKLQDALVATESPYRQKMDEAEWVIRESILAQGQSVTLHNVKAIYTKGRRSTSWKSVAEEMGAPEEIVVKFTKIGEPSVKVEAA